MFLHSWFESLALAQFTRRGGHPLLPDSACGLESVRIGTNGICAKNKSQSSFWLAAPSTSLRTGFTNPVVRGTPPQFSAVTSAFDDLSRPRYDKLWRISVIRVIVSFLFRIAIRWINARGIWYLVAGQ